MGKVVPVHRTIVIMISKLLKHLSKIKRRAPAYSRALRQIRGVVQSIVNGSVRSGWQWVRGGRLTVKNRKMDVVQAKSGEREDQVS